MSLGCRRGGGGVCKSSDKDMVCTTPARLRDMGSASQAIPFVNNSTVVDEVLFFFW